MAIDSCCNTNKKVSRILILRKEKKEEKTDLTQPMVKIFPDLNFSAQIFHSNMSIFKSILFNPQRNGIKAR